MQYFDLARPTDPAQAAMLAARPGAKYIGGGTDLMQLLKNDVERPTHLVDLDFVLDDRIDTQGGSLRIGGRARMSDAALHPLVAQNFPVVAEALLASASPQVRNMASMAGNLLQRTRCGYFRDTGFPCNKRVPGSGCPAIEGENRMLAVLGTSEACIASNPSDLAVALAAMDAALDLRGPDGARQLAVTDFHLLPGEHPEHETVLRPGEMIEAIRIPLSPMGRRSTYVKVRDRQSFEFAVVSAAVGLDMDGGTVRDARVALGGVGTKPWRARAAEAALRGRQAGDAAWRDAAAAALQGAVPRSKNAFKIKLAQSTLVRALAALA
jgi:xanthine dehydrogenase YagS FAD-binding subunit